MSDYDKKYFEMSTLEGDQIKTPVDRLAYRIYVRYLQLLTENGWRLFAGKSPYSTSGDYDDMTAFELAAFRKTFKPWFKTDSQFRKTKHYRSEAFVIKLEDLYGKPYTCYFTTTSNVKGYCEEIYEHFSKKMEFIVKQNRAGKR